MRMFKIIQEPGCIGCGACVNACPATWKMKETNGQLIAVPKKNSFEETELPENKEAADMCPVNVIHIEDEEGKRIT